MIVELQLQSDTSDLTEDEKAELADKVTKYCDSIPMLPRGLRLRIVGVLVDGEVY